MQREDFTVLLKVRHPQADPAIFTEMFDIAPECSWKAGETKRDGDTRATRRESFWVAKVPLRFPAFGDPKGSTRVCLEPGRALETLPDENRWIDPVGFPFGADRIPIEGALLLAALLFERRKETWTELKAEGATAELLLVLGRQASIFELSHDVLAMLSKCGLSISVDFQGAAEEAA